MSIHVQLTDEAKAKYESQKRASTITSIIITILSITLLALCLSFFFLKALTVEVPTIVTYHSTSVQEEEVSKKKVTHQVQKKPAAASSNIAKVIASTSPTNVSIPVPDVNTPDPSPDFGDSADFGAGWGDGDAGFGGSVSFFGNKVKGKNICFVIDYSASMRGERDKLMRKELAHSLETLSNGMNYSLIFFAGPAWVAGDTFKRDPKSKVAGTFTDDDGKKYVWEHGKGPKGELRKAEWTSVNDIELRKSLKHVKNTPLLFGTDWLHPLEMAMAMNPAPDVINFMTDGVTGNVESTIKKVSRLARNHDTVINCVALMDPKARAGMLQLAKENDGLFTMVEKSGERTTTDPNE